MGCDESCILAKVEFRLNSGEKLVQHIYCLHSNIIALVKRWDRIEVVVRWLSVVSIVLIGADWMKTEDLTKLTDRLQVNY